MPSGETSSVGHPPRGRVTLPLPEAKVGVGARSRMNQVQTLLERLDSREAKIAILGQGYVGLVVAMRASEAGFTVVGYEPDRRRFEALREARSYVVDVP